MLAGAMWRAASARETGESKRGGKEERETGEGWGEKERSSRRHLKGDETVPVGRGNPIQTYILTLHLSNPAALGMFSAASRGFS